MRGRAVSKSLVLLNHQCFFQCCTRHHQRVTLNCAQYIHRAIALVVSVLVTTRTLLKAAAFQGGSGG